jgi:hypothetical protein
MPRRDGGTKQFARTRKQRKRRGQEKARRLAQKEKQK